MKILFISGSFPYLKDGISDSAAILYDNLHHVSNTQAIFLLLTTEDKEIRRYIHQKSNENKTFYLNDWKLSFSNIKKIKKIILNESVDTVHVEYPGKGYGYGLLVNILPLIIKMFNRNIKIFIRYHEFTNSRLLRKIVDIPLLIFSDKIFIPSFEDYKILKKALGSKIKKTYIGSNIPVVKLDKKQNMQNSDQIIIGFFGFVYPNKGIENLLDIFSEIIQRQDNCKLLIIGELNDDNSYQRKILNDIGNKGLKDNIEITGYIEDSKQVSQIMQRVDVAILPFDDGLTLRRGSFLAFLEHNIPILTLNGDEECKRIFSNNEVVMAENYEELVEEFFYLIKNPIELKRRKENLVKLNNHFNWKTIAKSFLKEYLQ